MHTHVHTHTHTHTHTHMQFLQLPHLSADGPSTLLVLLLQCLKSQLSFLCAFLVLLCRMLELLPEFVKHCFPLGTQCMCVLQVLRMCMKVLKRRRESCLISLWRKEPCYNATSRTCTKSLGTRIEGRSERRAWEE